MAPAGCHGGGFPGMPIKRAPGSPHPRARGSAVPIGPCAGFARQRARPLARRVRKRYQCAGACVGVLRSTPPFPRAILVEGCACDRSAELGRPGPGSPSEVTHPEVPPPLYLPQAQAQEVYKSEDGILIIKRGHAIPHRPCTC